MTNVKLIRFADLAARGIPYTRTHISRMIHAGQFPKAVKIGTGTNGFIAFIESEIDDWIAARVAGRGASPAPRNMELA